MEIVNDVCIETKHKQIYTARIIKLNLHRYKNNIQKLLNFKNTSVQLCFKNIQSRALDYCSITTFLKENRRNKLLSTEIPQFKLILNEGFLFLTQTDSISYWNR